MDDETGGRVERAYFAYLDAKAKVLLVIAVSVAVLLVISLVAGGIEI